MEKIYISGKVTGLPMEEVEDKFMQAASIVRHHGCLAVIPVHHCRPEWSWQRCMKVCLALLLECDTILLLPDWKKSRGAKIEFLMAVACGLRIVKLKQFIDGTERSTSEPACNEEGVA